MTSGMLRYFSEFVSFDYHENYVKVCIETTSLGLMGM